MARFNFTIPDDGALDELQRQTQRVTKAEVVRDALAVYQMLLDRVRNGERIYLGRTKEDATELTITSLRPAQRVAW